MRIQAIYFFILLILVTGACSKKPVSVPHDGTMSMSIDDTLVSFSTQPAAMMVDVDREYFSFHLSAIDAPDSRRTVFLTLTLPHEIRPGTYTLRPGGVDSLVEMSLAYEVYQPRSFDAGRTNENFITMTISSRTDKRIQGTFEAILTNQNSDTTIISNGSFDYPFIYPRPI